MIHAIGLAFALALVWIGFRIGEFMQSRRPTPRDPVADALLKQYQREAEILKEVRRVCGVKETLL